MSDSFIEMFNYTLRKEEGENVGCPTEKAKFWPLENIYVYIYIVFVWTQTSNI